MIANWLKKLTIIVKERKDDVVYGFYEQICCCSSIGWIERFLQILGTCSSVLIVWWCGTGKLTREMRVTGSDWTKSIRVRVLNHVISDKPSHERRMPDWNCCGLRMLRIDTRRPPDGCRIRKCWSMLKKEQRCCQLSAQISKCHLDTVHEHGEKISSNTWALSNVSVAWSLKHRRCLSKRSDI